MTSVAQLKIFLVESAGNSVNRVLIPLLGEIRKFLVN